MAKVLVGNKHYNPEIVEKLAKEWGTGTKSALALQIAKLGLKDRGLLMNSISVGIKRKFGDVDAITFRYLYYGLFHNVGAKNVFGKGVTLPALHWKASGINPRIEDLADKVGEYYAQVLIKNIDFQSK